MTRIKYYEFRKTRTGRKLILWAPLERGGKTVLAAVEINGAPTPANLMGTQKIRSAIPDRLKALTP